MPDLDQIKQGKQGVRDRRGVRQGRSAKCVCYIIPDKFELYFTAASGGYSPPRLLRSARNDGGCFLVIARRAAPKQSR